MKTLHSILKKVLQKGLEYKVSIILVIGVILISNLFAIGYSKKYWSINKNKYKYEVLDNGELWGHLVSSMYYLIIQDACETEMAEDVLTKAEMYKFYTDLLKSDNESEIEMPEEEQEKCCSRLYSGYLDTRDWLHRNAQVQYYIKNEDTGNIITNTKEMERIRGERISDLSLSKNDLLYELNVAGASCTTSVLTGVDYLFGHDLADGFMNGYLNKYHSNIKDLVQWTDYVKAELKKNTTYTIYIGVRDITTLDEVGGQIDEDYNSFAVLWFCVLELVLFMLGTLAFSKRKQTRELKCNVLEIPAVGILLCCIFVPMVVIYDMLNMFDQTKNLFGSLGLAPCLALVLYAAGKAGDMRSRGLKDELVSHSLIVREYVTYKERKSQLKKSEKVMRRRMTKALLIKGTMLSFVGLVTCAVIITWFQTAIIYYLCIIGLILYLFIVWWIWFRNARKGAIARYHNYQLILQKASEMADGQIGDPIDEDLGEFAELGEAMNHIEEGLKKAVEEAITSQSMKTELITNVSHDLKTPLTSIVSYVDLLKRTDLTDGEKKEFIEILEQKSARLKVLIEDLFEMSKATSKDIKLTVAELNIVSLTKEVLVEYEKALDEKDLKVNLSFVSDSIKVTLDGQKTYRIIANLVGNIAKYAMPHTRVYVSVTKDEENVYLEFKNISATEIIHQGKELVERFVREDASRNTEGSGLGLGIAKSLSELQNGTLEVEVDGDLFKATVTFPLVTE